jgi:capsular polysaccharide biosynthesis protein
VLSEQTAGVSRRGADGQAFWWRLTYNLFRHLIWFLLPVVALGAIGIVQASETLEYYRSTATLNASENPLVPDQADGGAPGLWETPAEATARIINEQLGTNSFLDDIAERAGLSEPLDSGLLQANVLRRSLWATADGNSIMSVNARWSEPQTAYELANATVQAYRSYLSDNLTSNVSEAEAYYASQIDGYQADREEAEADLQQFLALLGNDEFSPVEQAQYDALLARLTNIDDKITAAQTQIDSFVLQRAQSESEAVRSLKTVDEPEVPTAPESTLVDRITTVATFLVLGVIIAAIALVVTTVLDQTVASPADLLAIEGVSLVATVPSLRFAGASGSRRSRSASRRSRRKTSRKRADR